MEILSLEKLSSELREESLHMGASHFGVADLTRYHQEKPEAFTETPYDNGELLTGIIILIQENHEYLDGLPTTDDLSRSSHYNIKIALGLRIADHISQRLVSEGFKTHRLSHPPAKGATGLLKASATMAGLGFIGKNRLLITPDAGPRVAPALVLTNAPIEATKNLTKTMNCGGCRRCIDICPSQALGDEPFGETDSLKGFNLGRCVAVRGVINPTGWGACSLCVQACPYGDVDRKKTSTFHDAFTFLDSVGSES